MPRRPGPHPHAPGRRTPSSNPRLPSPLGEKTWRKSPEKSPPAALCHAAAESKPRVRARNGTRPPLEGEIRIDIPAQVERERTLDSAARARPPPPPPRSRCSAFRKGGEVEEDVRRGGNRGGNILFSFLLGVGWGGGRGLGCVRTAGCSERIDVFWLSGEGGFPNQERTQDNTNARSRTSTKIDRSINATSSRALADSLISAR